MFPFVRSLLATACMVAAASASEPATHVLFLGADFSVSWQGKRGRIVDVTSDSLVIDVDGVRRPLRAASADLPIQMAPTMKLAQAEAEVSGLQGGTVFSTDADPARASEVGAALAQSAAADADHALGNLRGAELMAGAADADQLPDSHPMKAQLGSAQQAYRDSLHAQNSPTNRPGAAGVAPGAGHDAFQVSFSVASPRPLQHPFAMVFVRYFEQPDNVKTARVRIFPLTLPRVDTKPRRYHLVRAGFPPGYQLERYAIHLFENGTEIPTSISAKRVAITTDEAFQYTLAGHLADLKDRTQPPVPARDFWPGDLGARLSAENRNRFVYVRVDPNGAPIGAFHDAAGKLPVMDADIVAVLPRLRFFPALEKGKAVPGTCHVNLGSEAL